MLNSGAEFPLSCVEWVVTAEMLVSVSAGFSGGGHQNEAVAVKKLC